MLAFGLLDRMRCRLPSGPVESVFRDNNIGTLYERLTEGRAVLEVGQL